MLVFDVELIADGGFRIADNESEEFFHFVGEMIVYPFINFVSLGFLCYFFEQFDLLHDFYKVYFLRRNDVPDVGVDLDIFFIYFHFLEEGNLKII